MNQINDKNQYYQLLETARNQRDLVDSIYYFDILIGLFPDLTNSFEEKGLNQFELNKIFLL